MSGPSSPDRRQGSVGGVVVSLAAEAIALPAAVVTAMVVTRAFGPGVYGSYTVVATTVAVTEWLLVAVFARPVVKFVAETVDWRPVASTAFRVYLLSGLAIGVAFWALAAPLAQVLRDPALATYFRLFAIQIPVFAVGAASRNVLAGQARYWQQAVASGAGWIGRAVGIVAFVSMGYGIDGAIAGSIAGTAVGALVGFVLMGWPGWRVPGFPARHLWELALAAFIALLFARLVDQVGLLSVQALAPSEVDVGYYGAAMNVMLLTAVVAAAVAPILVSSLTRARYRRDEDEAQRIVRGALRFGTVLFAYAAIVAGAGDELATLFFGPQFAPAGALMAALIVAAVSRTNLAMIDALLIAAGRAWLAAVLAVPLPFIAVAAHTVVIPRFGAGGAALVTMTVTLLATVVFTAAVCRVMRVPYPVATLARSATIGAAAWAVAAFWQTPGPLVLVKAALLAAGVAAALVATGELSRAELGALRVPFRGGLTGRSEREPR